YGGRGKRAQDVLLRLRAHSRERSQTLRLRGFAQLLQRCDPELLPDLLRALRPQAGQAHEEDDLVRDLGLAPRERVDLAVPHDLDDLLLDRLADSLQRLRAAG